MKLTCLLASVVMLSLLSACGAPEPVATGYKKQILNGAPAGATPAPGTPPATSGNAAVANLTNGQAVYGKVCASCHQPLATTAKPNKTAAVIEANSPDKNPSHKPVLPADWPKGAVAADVALALKK